MKDSFVFSLSLIGVAYQFERCLWALYKWIGDYFAESFVHMGAEEGAFIVVALCRQIQMAVQMEHMANIFLRLFSVDPQNALHALEPQDPMQGRGH